MVEKAERWEWKQTVYRGIRKSAGLCGSINISAKTSYYIYICIHYLKKKKV